MMPVISINELKPHNTLKDLIEACLAVYMGSCKELPLNNVISILKKRGYTESDFEQTIEKHFNFSPHLLLNSLYESFIELHESVSKIPIDDERSSAAHNRIISLLKLVEQIGKKIAPDTDYVLAHFIWVGTPKKNQSEMLGARSLSRAKPEQKIRFWALDEHVAYYWNQFATYPHVTVVSIENYAKKLNVSFDRENVVTLHSQIEKYKNYARDKFRNAKTSLERKMAIRDLVTIVDYVKAFLTLFESGYVFDSDIAFFKDAPNPNPLPLRKEKKWMVPRGPGGNTDFWFFYCPYKMPWSINKKNGGAFEWRKYDFENTWQMNLLIYHKAVLAVESYNRECLRLSKPINCKHIAKQYGDGLHAMYKSSWDYVELTRYWDVCEIQKKEAGDLENPISLPAADWYFEKYWKDICSYVEADYCLIRKSFEMFVWYTVKTADFHLMKRMNSSHRCDLPDRPTTLFTLALYDINDFSRIMSVMHECGCNGELWEPVPGGFYPDNVTPIHLCLFICPDLFKTLIQYIPKNVLVNLCHSRVEMPDHFFPHQPGEKYTLIDLIIVRNAENKLKETLRCLGHDLSGLDFNSANFDGFDFSGCHFSNAIFNKNDLNNMTIDAETNFSNIQIGKEIICDQFYFRFPSGEMVTVKTTDFISQFSARIKGAPQPPFFNVPVSSGATLLYILSRIVNNKDELLQTMQKISGEKNELARQ